jgi:Sugar (and other) transporter
MDPIPASRTQCSLGCKPRLRRHLVRRGLPHSCGCTYGHEPRYSRAHAGCNRPAEGIGPCGRAVGGRGRRCAASHGLPYLLETSLCKKAGENSRPERDRLPRICLEGGHGRAYTQSRPQLNVGAWLIGASTAWLLFDLVYFIMIGLSFSGLCLVPSATTTVAPFLILFGATYFFSEFGPNTTTFVYPAEIFPVRVRTTSHGIAAASGKIGAFVGTYALTVLLPRIGLGDTSALVATVAILGAVITITMLPEPKGGSLEEITEGQQTRPTSETVLGLAESRGVRPPAA